MPRDTPKRSLLQRRWIRWPWNIVRALIALILLMIPLIALTVATIVGTESGFRKVVQVGLEQYNPMIPGSIAVGRVHGSLLEGFDLEGIALKDADGDPLFSLDALRLRWDPIGLVDGRLSIPLLSIERGELHLREKARGSTFLDLAPPSSETPPPEPEPPKPDPRYLGISLPIRVALDRLNVDDFTVYSYENDTSAPLAKNVSVQLSAWMHHRRAGLKITDLSAKVPVAELDVQRVQLDASWDDPAATVHSLTVRTNLASLSLEHTFFDALRLENNATLSVRAPAETLHKYTGMKFRHDAEVQLSTQGDLSKLELKTSLKLGGSALHVEGTVAAKPVPSADLDYRFSHLPPQDYGLPLSGNLSGRGSLHATGDALETLKAKASFHCAHCRLERFGDFSLDLDGSLDEMKAKGTVRADVADILISARAHSPDQNHIQADFSIVSETLYTIASAFDIPGIDGRLNLEGRCKGELTNPSCSVSAMLEALRAAEQGVTVQRLALDLDAREVATKQAFETRITLDEISVPSLELKQVGLSAKGTPKRIDAQCSIEKNEHNSGTFALRLQPGPPLSVLLKSGKGRVSDVALSVTKPGRVTVRGSAVRVRDLGLGIEESELTVDGRFNPQGSNDLTVNLKGFQLATLQKVVPEPVLSGTTDLLVRLKGPASAPNIHLATNIQGLAVAEYPYGDLGTTVDWKTGKIDVTLRLNKENKERFALAATVPARLNLQSGKFVWQERVSHHAHWKLTDFSSADLAPFAKLPPDTRFTISNEGTFNGTIRRPNAELSVKGDVFHKDLDIPFAIQVHALPDRQSVHADFDASGPFALSLEAVSKTEVGGLVDGAVEPMSIPIEAKLAMERFELATLDPFLPESLYDLRGRLALALDVSGTVGDPKVSGTVGLEGGEVTVVDLYQRYENIRLDLQLTETRDIALKNLSLTSGEGSMTMQGHLKLGEKFEPTGSWTLAFNAFPLEFPGVPPSRLDAGVDLSVQSGTDEMKIGATLRETQVTVLSFTSDTPREIPKNERIVFVEDTKKPAKDKKAGGGPTMAVKVDINDPIVILGNQVDMSWGGEIDVAINEEGTAVTGGLDNKRGWFEFLGNQFEVEQARLSFPDGTQNEPFVNLVAGADTPEARVYLNVKGAASRPELAFSSEPAMPQYQIFTLLVTGSTETNEDSDDEVQGKAANLGAGLIAFQYPELQRQMSDRLGIDRVSLTFGETTEEPILTVGKRLTRRIMVESSYHHNAPEDVNRAELKIDLMLTPKWDLETFYGDASVGGMDVFWHTSFGNEPPPPPDASAPSPRSPETPTETQP